MNGMGFRSMIRGLRSCFRGWGFGLAVESMVHGSGLSTTSGSKSQSTILQCRPHAAPPCPPSTSPPYTYIVLGISVRLRRQKCLNRGVVLLQNSIMQRRPSLLRHAPPRQPSPLRVGSSAACNRCQRSEHSASFFCGYQTECAESFETASG